MPRAHRHFVAGQVWHVTHRCHERAFLLKFAHDRGTYLHWLFQAKKRYGLCILDYMVTCNHVHLVVRDDGSDVIARSMQLAAGRTAQEFNRRKTRRGAFWEDRYHATAIETGDHLHRCLVYVALNMVRAGVVQHPREWPHGGYNEMQRPPQRYSIIDVPCLAALCGFDTVEQFRSTYRTWVESAISRCDHHRDASWTEAVAVGTPSFIAGVQRELGSRGLHRHVTETEAGHVLRQPVSPYDADFGGKNGVVSLRSNLLFD